MAQIVCNVPFPFLVLYSIICVQKLHRKLLTQNTITIYLENVRKSLESLAFLGVHSIESKKFLYLNSARTNLNSKEVLEVTVG